MKLTREKKIEILKAMGEPVPAHLLEPAKADVAGRSDRRLDPPKARDESAPGRAPHEYPRCAKCGGQPQLGVSEGDKVVSYCRKCARENYLAKLTPEERALLRDE